VIGQPAARPATHWYALDAVMVAHDLSVRPESWSQSARCRLPRHSHAAQSGECMHTRLMGARIASQRTIHTPFPAPLSICLMPSSVVVVLRAAGHRLSEEEET
jgi:hypothetical protein